MVITRSPAKGDTERYMGPNPIDSAEHWYVGQSVVRLAVNEDAGGSIPPVPAGPRFCGLNPVL